jgi:P pilus assembly chaperone PapD
VAVKMAIRMGLPVFVEPEVIHKDRKIEKMQLADGSLKVTVKNSGNSHFVVSKIKAKGQDESHAEVFAKEVGGWYVLAGAANSFDVEVPKADCLKAKAIKAEAEVEKEVLTSTLQVETNLCADKPRQPARNAITDPGEKKQ